MKILKNILIISLIILSSCSIFKKKPKDQAAPVEKKKRINPNAFERAEQADGIIFGRKGSGGTTYEFATSNILWRASLETLDFIPLSNLTYSGGVIVTDWYSGPGGNQNEQVKINIRFKSNELKASSVVVQGFKKVCSSGSNCSVSKLSNNFNSKIKEQILIKAKQLKIAEETKKLKE